MDSSIKLSASPCARHDELATEIAMVQRDQFKSQEEIAQEHAQEQSSSGIVIFKQWHASSQPMHADIVHVTGPRLSIDGLEYVQHKEEARDHERTDQQQQKELQEQTHTLSSRSVEGLQTEVERHVNPNRLKLKGVMRKKGQINTAWKDRFFALTEGGVCSYYDNENKFLAQGSVANGSFSCEGLIVESGGQSKEGFHLRMSLADKDGGPVTIVSRAHSNAGSSRFSREFSRAHSSAGSRPAFECACKNLEERNAWVEALRAAASQFVVPEPASGLPLPVKLWEGPDDDFKRQPGETFDITLTRNARGSTGLGCARQDFTQLTSK